MERETSISSVWILYFSTIPPASLGPALSNPLRSAAYSSSRIRSLSSSLAMTVISSSPRRSTTSIRSRTESLSHKSSPRSWTRTEVDSSVCSTGSSSDMLSVTTAFLSGTSVSFPVSVISPLQPDKRKENRISKTSRWIHVSFISFPPFTVLPLQQLEVLLHLKNSLFLFHLYE